MSGEKQPRVVKPAAKDARLLDRGPTMHESKAERNLMSGTGALIKWSGDRVGVSGEKPGGGKQR